MLDYSSASELVLACRTRAGEAQQEVAVAVADELGQVLGRWRPPAVHPLFGDLSAAKAVTSVKFPMPLAELQAWQQAKPLLHLQLSTLDQWPVVAAAGSGRLESDGVLLGALGVSTREGSFDQQICDRALADGGYTFGAGPDHSPATDTPRAQSPSDGYPLTAEDAEAIMRGVVTESQRQDLAVAVAVVDRRGDLLCSFRTHPSGGTLRLAQAKAYSSAVMHRSTVALEDWQSDNPVLAMQLSGLGDHPIIVDHGGYPVCDRPGDVVGGVGVSGARGEQDQQLCEAILQALGYVSAAPDGAWPADQHG